MTAAVILIAVSIMLALICESEVLLAIALLVVVVALLTGCALAPERVNAELQHTSKISQHRPLTNEPTDYGFSAAGLEAEWAYKRARLSLFEGAVLDGCEQWNGTEMCGSMPRNREVFNARIDVALWEKK